MSGRLRYLVSIVGAMALVAAVIAVLVIRGGSSPRHEGDGDKDKDDPGHEMAEALEKHPGLASHRQALAFVAEKLAQQGGDSKEATGEIISGPNQENYEERALPHASIAPAQQTGAASAAARAAARATTKRGGKALLATVGGRHTTIRTSHGKSHAAARHAAGVVTTARSWKPIGPEGGLQVPQATYTGNPAYVSGRTTALATTGACSVGSCTLYVGTAGGGLWKTSNALATIPTWKSIGSKLPSDAIGSITIGADGTLWVGTGEPNGSSDSEAGLGLFKSTNGGASFSKVPTTVGGNDFTTSRSVGAIAIDPNNPAHILIGTTVARHGASSVNGGRFTPPGAQPVGLYESINGGSTWTLALSEASDPVDPSSANGSDFFRGGVSKIAFDPTHSGTVYASMFDYGLYRATSAGGAWTRIYSIHNPGALATSSTNRVEFAVASLPGGATRIYLGDSTHFTDATAGLLRTDDATTATPTWTDLSSSTEGSPGYGSYNFCETQCSYDMVVTSPAGAPDEVFLSGSMNYDELQAFGGPGDSNGRAIVRSDDAGVHVTDMTNDASDNGLHPDQHGLVFANTPGTETFFSASDGGVVEQNGPYVDKSADCAGRGLAGVELTDCQQYLSKVPTTNNTQMNRGLETLQFQSVSVAPGGIVQGGTQDNGTWESDQSGFAETVGGDGGQSGFNVSNPAIRYHSYFNPSHDVSFTGGNATGWDYIGDPFTEASSFYTPFTPDPVTAGTVFDGLQHIWRTTDNGGSQAFLDQYCNELTGDYSHRPQPCGDWVKLGGAAGDLSGGSTANYLAAVERAPSDTGTLWAGTRLGGIYVSTNANAADPNAVSYTRLDTTLGLPHRFPSGIAIDPADPDHVFISYSGYTAYSPGGHVYEVTYNPSTHTGTATDLSAGLGDQPITDIVYVPRTKSLFVSTDFGVLAGSIKKATPKWVTTPGLPVVAVYGLTYDTASKTLYAATHGRSVWKLTVG